MSREHEPSAPGHGGEAAGHPERALLDLVVGVRRGDRDAAEAFAAALYPVVRSALARRLRRGAAVEIDDVTQASVARAVARVDRCAATDDRGVRAWARAVAWRVALEELRTGAAALARESRPLDAGDHLPRPRSGFVTAATVDDRDGGCTPLARAAVEALDRMPPQVGLLFWMRLVDDASWPEIAESLGTTTAGVKRRFQRAAAALRRALTTGGPHADPGEHV